MSFFTIANPTAYDDWAARIGDTANDVFDVASQQQQLPGAVMDASTRAVFDIQKLFCANNKQMIADYYAAYEKELTITKNASGLFVAHQAHHYCKVSPMPMLIAPDMESQDELKRQKDNGEKPNIKLTLMRRCSQENFFRAAADQLTQPTDFGFAIFCLFTLFSQAGYFRNELETISGEDWGSATGTEQAFNQLPKKRMVQIVCAAHRSQCYQTLKSCLEQTDERQQAAHYFLRIAPKLLLFRPSFVMFVMQAAEAACKTHDDFTMLFQTNGLIDVALTHLESMNAPANADYLPVIQKLNAMTTDLMLKSCASVERLWTFVQHGVLKRLHKAFVDRKQTDNTRHLVSKILQNGTQLQIKYFVDIVCERDVEQSIEIVREMKCSHGTAAFFSYIAQSQVVLSETSFFTMCRFAVTSQWHVDQQLARLQNKGPEQFVQTLKNVVAYQYQNRLVIKQPVIALNWLFSEQVIETSELIKAFLQPANLHWLEYFDEKYIDKMDHLNQILDCQYRQELMTLLVLACFLNPNLIKFIQSIKSTNPLLAGLNDFFILKTFNKFFNEEKTLAKNEKITVKDDEKYKFLTATDTTNHKIEIKWKNIPFEIQNGDNLLVEFFLHPLHAGRHALFKLVTVNNEEIIIEHDTNNQLETKIIVIYKNKTIKQTITHSHIKISFQFDRNQMFYVSTQEDSRDYQMNVKHSISNKISSMEFGYYGDELDLCLVSLSILSSKQDKYVIFNRYKMAIKNTAPQIKFTNHQQNQKYIDQDLYESTDDMYLRSINEMLYLSPSEYSGTKQWNNYTSCMNMLKLYTLKRLPLTSAMQRILLLATAKDLPIPHEVLFGNASLLFEHVSHFPDMLVESSKNEQLFESTKSNLKKIIKNALKILKERFPDKLPYIIASLNHSYVDPKQQQMILKFFNNSFLKQIDVTIEQQKQIIVLLLLNLKQEQQSPFSVQLLSSCLHKFISTIGVELVDIANREEMPPLLQKAFSVFSYRYGKLNEVLGFSLASHRDQSTILTQNLLAILFEQLLMKDAPAAFKQVHDFSIPPSEVITAENSGSLTFIDYLIVSLIAENDSDGGLCDRLLANSGVGKLVQLLSVPQAQLMPRLSQIQLSQADAQCPLTVPLLCRVVTNCMLENVRQVVAHFLIGCLQCQCTKDPIIECIKKEQNLKFTSQTPPVLFDVLFDITDGGIYIVKPSYYMNGNAKALTEVTSVRLSMSSYRIIQNYGVKQAEYIKNTYLKQEYNKQMLRLFMILRADIGSSLDSASAEDGFDIGKLGQLITISDQDFAEVMQQIPVEFRQTSVSNILMLNTKHGFLRYRAFANVAKMQNGQGLSAVNEILPPKAQLSNKTMQLILKIQGGVGGIRLDLEKEKKQKLQPEMQNQVAFSIVSLIFAHNFNFSCSDQQKLAMAVAVWKLATMYQDLLTQLNVAEGWSDFIIRITTATYYQDFARVAAFEERIPHVLSQNVCESLPQMTRQSFQRLQIQTIENPTPNEMIQHYRAFQDTKCLTYVQRIVRPSVVASLQALIPCIVDIGKTRMSASLNVSDQLNVIHDGRLVTVLREDVVQVRQSIDCFHATLMDGTAIRFFTRHQKVRAFLMGDRKQIETKSAERQLQALIAQWARGQVSNTQAVAAIAEVQQGAARYPNDTALNELSAAQCADYIMKFDKQDASEHFQALLKCKISSRVLQLETAFPNVKQQILSYRFLDRRYLAILGRPRFLYVFDRLNFTQQPIQILLTVFSQVFVVQINSQRHIASVACDSSDFFFVQDAITGECLIKTSVFKSRFTSYVAGRSSLYFTNSFGLVVYKISAQPYLQLQLDYPGWGAGDYVEEFELDLQYLFVVFRGKTQIFQGGQLVESVSQAATRSQLYAKDYVKQAETGCEVYDAREAMIAAQVGCVADPQAWVALGCGWARGSNVGWVE